jgi:hypothetical protein
MLIFTQLIPAISIGINPQLAHTERHGVAWVRSDNDGVIPQAFKVDKPKRLIRPSKTTVRQMFEQIEKMGMVPYHLEIMVNNTQTIYKRNHDQPVLIQRM